MELRLRQISKKELLNVVNHDGFEFITRDTKSVSFKRTDSINVKMTGNDFMWSLLLELMPENSKKQKISEKLDKQEFNTDSLLFDYPIYETPDGYAIGDGELWLYATKVYRASVKTVGDLDVKFFRELVNAVLMADKIECEKEDFFEALAGETRANAHQNELRHICDGLKIAHN